jgi:indole-3-glycerol phosphate synthase
MDDMYEEIRDSEDSMGKPLNLFDCIKKSYPKMAIAAEFKKASPSKGPINIDADPVRQCLDYTSAGASVISVLTEFKHFKG